MYDRRTIAQRADARFLIDAWSDSEHRRIHETHDYNMRVINICAAIGFGVIALSFILSFFIEAFFFGVLIGPFFVLIGPNVYKKEFVNEEFEDYVRRYDEEQAAQAQEEFDRFVSPADEPDVVEAEKESVV